MARGLDGATVHGESRSQAHAGIKGHLARAGRKRQVSLCRQRESERRLGLLRQPLPLHASPQAGTPAGLAREIKLNVFVREYIPEDSQR